VSWRLVSVISGAAVAGVLATWFAMHAGAGAPPSDLPAIAVATLASPDAAAPDAAAPDAAAPDAAAPDAAAPDAAAPDIAPPDPAPSPPTDAADGSDASIEADDIEVIDPVARRPAPRPAGARPAATRAVALPGPVVPAGAPVDVLMTLYQNDKYAEIVTNCRWGVTADTAAFCVRAACKEGSEQLAASWLKYIATETTRLQTSANCQQDLQTRVAASPPASRSQSQPQLTPDDRAELATCGATVMNARRAPDCTRVACRAGAPSKAFKWVAYVPAAQRTTVVAQCSQVGIDLTTQKLDCAADPAACP
jgi:hypothetical protein